MKPLKQYTDNKNGYIGKTTSCNEHCKLPIEMKQKKNRMILDYR